MGGAIAMGGMAWHGFGGSIGRILMCTNAENQEHSVYGWAVLAGEGGRMAGWADLMI
jgi:hypothetical protein